MSDKSSVEIRTKLYMNWRKDWLVGLAKDRKLVSIGDKKDIAFMLAKHDSKNAEKEWAIISRKG